MLNECQRYSAGGEIDSGILASFSDVSINDLTKNLKEKNFSEVRKWVSTNLDNDTTLLFRRIYDSFYETLVANSIPAAVLILAKYQYQVAFVADQEINMLACLTEIMVECTFQMTKVYKTKAQMKSNMYYVFGVLAPLAVMAGQIYVGTGYSSMSESHLTEV